MIRLFVALSVAFGSAAVLSLLLLGLPQFAAAQTSVPVGTNPFSVVVNPVTNKIYLANDLTLGQPTGITVIDGATNATEVIAAPTTGASVASE